MRGPERRHTVVMKIGADTSEALARALEQMAFEIRAGELQGNAVSGSPDYGYTFHHRLDESVTHDSYFAELEKYLDERKASDENRTVLA